MSRSDPRPTRASPLPDDDAPGRATLRKISLRLLPLLALGYGTAYMDRVNVSFAALQMNHDLHFSPAVYGLGAGLFFLSYAACEVPSNLLLVRVGARRWLARIMLTWGLLSIAMLFVRTPRQFYIMRFLLGIAEAGFFPGIIYYLTQWFPMRARSRAVSRFYIALPLSSVVMGSLAGALLHLDGRGSLAGWQWLFLVEGLPALALSAVYLFMLPDSPSAALWLSTAEREWLLATLAREHAGATRSPNHDQPTPSQHGGSAAVRALREPRVWALGLFLFSFYLGMYAFAFIAPALIQSSMHVSAATAGYIVAALGLLGAATMLWNGAHSDRTAERYLHIVLPCLLMTAGLLAAGLGPAPALALAAFAAIVAGANAVNAVIWTLPGNFLTGHRHRCRQHGRHGRRLPRPLLDGPHAAVDRQLPQRPAPLRSHYATGSPHRAGRAPCLTKDCLIAHRRGVCMVQSQITGACTGTSTKAGLRRRQNDLCRTFWLIR